MKTQFVLLIILVFGLSLVGCSANGDSGKELDSPPQTQEPSDEESGYPVDPSDLSAESGYPADDTDDAEAGYPIEEPQSSIPQGPVFTINTPISGGDTVVTGTGPAGVPILLVDASRVGLILGETTIDQDGTFTFNIDTPLESGNSIGLQLGDLTGTDLIESDFIYSDTYYVRPMIGILFDMVTVD